jgi:hypothetical protein
LDGRNEYEDRCRVHLNWGPSYSRECASVAAAYQRGLRAGVPTWQPMETAPGNGRPIIVGTVDGFVCIAKRYESMWWMDHGSRLDAPLVGWMPLPSPPVDAALAEKLGGGG